MQRGFTIVELLIVVVVIAVLVAVTVVSYQGVTRQAAVASLKTDLSTAATKLKLEKVDSGAFPASASGLAYLDGLSYEERVDVGFSVSGSTSSGTFHITGVGVAVEGGCPPVPAVVMQTVVTASCSTGLTMAVDARDSQTYWIKKMPDGKCWMLTSLGYGGGGVDTYGDVIPKGDGSGGTLSYINGSSGHVSDLARYYYFWASANNTVNPTPPSVSTDGGTTNPQYGYLHNWCAAMGSQAGTSACGASALPVPNQATSICPAGWRLPTGAGVSGEFKVLAESLYAGNNTEGADIMKTQWMAQMGGDWYGGLSSGGVVGRYWSGTSNGGSAHYLSVSHASVNHILYYAKTTGYSVRCVAGM